MLHVFLVFHLGSLLYILKLHEQFLHNDASEDRFTSSLPSTARMASQAKEAKEREISITFFPSYHPTVFLPRLAPDANARRAEAITRFVVMGRKIDEKVSFLASAFFLDKESLGD